MVAVTSRGGMVLLWRGVGLSVGLVARGLVVGCLVVAALVGCSSSGDGREDGRGGGSGDPLDGDGRRAYVVAFERAGRDPVSGEVREEAGCMAEAIVDGVGLDDLRGAVTPRQVAEAANRGGVALAALGVEPDEAQVDAVYEGIQECGDPVELFLGDIPGPQLPRPAVECFEERLDDDLLRQILMTRLVDGDTAFADMPEVTARLNEIGWSCAS
jgi:hypothetical protein